MRLIDADLVIDTVNEFKGKNRKTDLGIKLVEEIVSNAPTVEAERHGHWIMLHKTHNTDGDNDYDWRCSECNHVDCHNISVEVPYCWYCGAKMDAKGEEQ